MSVETLRCAAALMRECAKAVPPEGLSDWWFDAEASDLMHLRQSDREQIAYFGHPAVALAVADWLEGEAAELEEALDALAFLGPPVNTPSGGRFGRPLAVANAYMQATR